MEVLLRELNQAIPRVPKLGRHAKEEFSEQLLGQLLEGQRRNHTVPGVCFSRGALSQRLQAVEWQKNFSR